MKSCLFKILKVLGIIIAIYVVIFLISKFTGNYMLFYYAMEIPGGIIIGLGTSLYFWAIRNPGTVVFLIALLIAFFIFMYFATKDAKQRNDDKTDKQDS